MTKVYVRTAEGAYLIEENGTFRRLASEVGVNDSQAALRILADALDDSERATQVYQRFKWRLNMENTIGKPFRLSHAKVLSMVADIEQVEKETRMSRIIVERERPPVVNDRGGGVVWDKEHK